MDRRAKSLLALSATAAFVLTRPLLLRAPLFSAAMAAVPWLVLVGTALTHA